MHYNRTTTLRAGWLSLLALIAFCSTARAQKDTTDIAGMLNDNAPVKKDYTIATFKATRIINGSSVENLGKGLLDFRISHRFGKLNEGAHNFFGLDDATTRLGLDYGITDWLMVGIGHSTLYKENDGMLKLRILRQRNDGGSPVTVSYVGAVSEQGMPAPQLPAGDTYDNLNRFFFTNQILIARKFNDWLSLQVMPSIVHFNVVDSSNYNGKASNNNVLAIGVGGRVKVSHRIAITGEYYYAAQAIGAPGTYNSLSLGIDIETGGHVFQLMFTNSRGMTERTFIGQTTDDWGKGDIHFGFNISRIFTVVRPKEFKNSRNKIW